MSNEPLPAPSAPDPSTQPAPDSPAQNNRAADAALMLAAVERMEAVMRGERATFDRLRADLGDMASTLALAKAALASFTMKPDEAAQDKGGDIGTLLEAIEDRVRTMVEFIDGAKLVVEAPVVAVPPAAEVPAPANEQPAEAMVEQQTEAATELQNVMPVVERDRVPTVSDVVFQLNLPASPEAVAGDAPAAPSEDVPNFAMLETLVEALTAEMPKALPAEALAPEVLPPEALAPEPLVSEPLALEPSPPEATAPEPEPVILAEPSAPETATAEPELPVNPPMMPDVDLMASFAQVAAMPFLPSEIGTAVIFTPKEAAPEPELQIVPPVLAAPQPEETPETTAELPPAVVAEALPVEPPLSVEVEGAAIEPPPVDLPSLDNDPAEFLYEPDPDPASFLLEPISFVPTPRPAPAVQAVTTQAPLAAAMLPPIAMTTVMPGEPEPAPPSVQPATEPDAPYDPLAPLKSMSVAEKIALFS